MFPEINFEMKLNEKAASKISSLMKVRVYFFKTVDNDGCPAKYIICIVDNILFITKRILMDKEMPVGSGGFDLLRKFKGKYLYSQSMRIKPDSLKTILHIIGVLR
jgi:hypothetical protein